MPTRVQTSVIYDANGSQTVFTFPFDLLGAFSAVRAQLLVAESVYVDLSTDSYTVNREAKTVTFAEAPEGTLRISRFTDRHRLVNYQGGSTILADENLDADSDQAYSIMQELEDGAIESVITGGTITDISLPIVLPFAGDGFETFFELTGVLNIARAQAFVVVENVLQPAIEENPYYNIINPSDDDFPSGFSGNYDVLEFTTPPVSGATIVVTVLRGIVVAALAPNSIGTDNIVDGAVTPAKISVGGGQDKRVLVFDVVGEATARVLTPEDIVGEGSLSTALINAIVDASEGISISDLLKLPGESLNMNGEAIVNLATPTGTSPSTQAATKGYVDGLGAQIQVQSGTFTQAQLQANGQSLNLGLTFTPDLLILHYPKANETSTPAVYLPLPPFIWNFRNDSKQIYLTSPEAFPSSSLQLVLSAQKIAGNIVTLTNNSGAPGPLSATCRWLALRFS